MSTASGAPFEVGDCIARAKSPRKQNVYLLRYLYPMHLLRRVGGSASPSATDLICSDSFINGVSPRCLPRAQVLVCGSWHHIMVTSQIQIFGILHSMWTLVAYHNALQLRRDAVLWRRVFPATRRVKAEGGTPMSRVRAPSFIGATLAALPHE